MPKPLPLRKREMDMLKLEKKDSMNRRIDQVLHKFRSRMSSYPPGMCPLALYRSLLQISMNQSCGKCVPCRDGLVELKRMLDSILNGDGSPEILESMKSLCQMIRRTADCAVGVAAADLILDSMNEFEDEYRSHIHHKKCVENVIQTVPCMTLCPAHVDVPAYIALIKEGDYPGAVNMIRKNNPFPTACAMVCEHPCEKKCRRSIIDQPINIRGLKMYAVNQNPADQVELPGPNVSTGKKIAVVGAGPSGMTAAYFLALMGHRVVVFEEHEKPGGMLRYGIPAYRLPKERLDEDLRAIEKAGNIEIRCGIRIGRDLSFEDLRSGYDAVYLALGAQIGNRMPMENADAGNVIPAADFLQETALGRPMNLEGKKVALIGGGNVAMDAARTAIRLKAESVHVFTRKRDDLTALPEEIEGAMQEGVRFRTLLGFLHIETDKEGKLSAVWLQPQIVGEYDRFGMMTTEHSSAYPYRFPCDVLILAVGQSSDTACFEEAGLPVTKTRIAADETCMVKGMPGIFSGGDCVTGPSTAINAIAAGRVAAFNIDEYLGYHHRISFGMEPPAPAPNACIPTGRAEIEEKDPFERRCNFDPVEISMNDEEAMREAGRCLRCDFYGCGSMEGGRGE